MAPLTAAIFENSRQRLDERLPAATAGALDRRRRRRRHRRLQLARHAARRRAKICWPKVFVLVLALNQPTFLEDRKHDLRDRKKRSFLSLITTTTTRTAAALAFAFKGPNAGDYAPQIAARARAGRRATNTRQQTATARNRFRRRKTSCFRPPPPLAS